MVQTEPWTLIQNKVAEPTLSNYYLTLNESTMNQLCKRVGVTENQLLNQVMRSHSSVSRVYFSRCREWSKYA